MAKSEKTRRPVAPRNTFWGRPIRDASEGLSLLVAKLDIRGAKPGTADQCAGARAIRRQDKRVEYVEVHGKVTLVVYEDETVRYRTPAALNYQIKKYDDTKTHFEEGEYELLPPPPHMQLGADHRPSNRGGGADKRGAAAVHARPAGRRPDGPKTYRARID